VIARALLKSGRRRSQRCLRPFSCPPCLSDRGQRERHITGRRALLYALEGRVSLLELGLPARPHKKRFAARRKSSTDPDVTTTAVMLCMLRAADDSTIGKRSAGAAGLARSDLDFDCFLAAMINPLGSGCTCGLTLTLPRRSLSSILRHRRTSRGSKP
jgi:hypothetical protein